MNQPLVQQVREHAHHTYAPTLEDREHLHRHPELSFEEVQTGKYISDQLTALGIPHTTGWSGHGIVAEIKGSLTGGCIALRADIDALPIQETSDVPYKSTVDGVMHACGHDVHTASLLGVARILWRLKQELAGTVILFWQPGEEKLPGGASIMIKEGLLDQYKPTYVIGQHVHPPLEAGKVGIKGGPYMASADEIFIHVHGKGGHAALPHKAVDPIVVMAQLINNLQQVISRHAPPTTPSVLTFGKIYSHGGATNVIPDTVTVEGTFRAMDEEWRDNAHEHIRRLSTNICKAHGGRAEVDIRRGYPYLHNHEELTDLVRLYMQEYLGEKDVVDLPIRMTAEDFSYYSQKADCCFYRLGINNQELGITSPVHTSTFDIDSKALEVGAGTMAYIAMRLLQSLVPQLARLLSHPGE